MGRSLMGRFLMGRFLLGHSLVHLVCRRRALLQSF